MVTNRLMSHSLRNRRMFRAAKRNYAWKSHWEIIEASESIYELAAALNFGTASLSQGKHFVKIKDNYREMADLK